MMDVMWSIAGFLVAIGVLVAFHEFGHYWVARRCGVKVLRFSIGFGKPLLTRRAADGVEWVVSAIPLGGYVKMLDSREAEVAEHERHLAFDQQPVRKRALIVAAGPVFNFILAVFFYWLIFVVGLRACARSSPRRLPTALPRGPSCRRATRSCASAARTSPPGKCCTPN